MKAIIEFDLNNYLDEERYYDFYRINEVDKRINDQQIKVDQLKAVIEKAVHLGIWECEERDGLINEISLDIQVTSILRDISSRLP